MDVRQGGKSHTRVDTRFPHLVHYVLSLSITLGGRFVCLSGTDRLHHRGYMARKSGKQYQAAQKQVEAKDYLLEQAIPLIKKIKYEKFDETVEVHMRLGVDPKHADQMVRGTVLMPNGLGKSKKVLVIASGDKLREAQEAGADFVGGEDMVKSVRQLASTLVVAA